MQYGLGTTAVEGLSGTFPSLWGTALGSTAPAGGELEETSSSGGPPLCGPCRGPHTLWSHQLRVRKWCWDVMPGLLHSRPGYSANSLAPGAYRPADPSSCLGTLPSSLGSSSGKWMRALRTVISAPSPQRRAQPRAPHVPGTGSQHLPRGPDSLVSVGSFPELVGCDPPGEVGKAHGVLEVEVRDCCVLDESKATGSERPGRGARTLEPRPLLKPRKQSPRG